MCLNVFLYEDFDHIVYGTQLIKVLQDQEKEVAESNSKMQPPSM